MYKYLPGGYDIILSIFSQVFVVPSIELVNPSQVQNRLSDLQLPQLSDLVTNGRVAPWRHESSS